MGNAERLTPEVLTELARRLEPTRLAEVADFIEWLQAKQDRELPSLLRDAPLDDEPTTPGDLMAIAEALESIEKEGTITHEQLKAELGL